MKILEILVFEDKEGLFSEFSQFLPMTKLEQSNLPAFRLEIDRDLILLFYCIDKNSTISQQYLKNVFPHLSRLIWLSDKQNFLDLNPPEDFQTLYDEYDSHLPSTVILAGDGRETKQPAETGMKPGYYLGKESRLFFWNQNQPEDRNRIWQMMWEE